MGNTHGITQATKAALGQFDLETKALIESEAGPRAMKIVQKSRAMERLSTVLRRRFKETKREAEIPALSTPNFYGQYVPVYYVCPHKMKSDFFPEPLAFAEVSRAPDSWSFSDLKAMAMGTKKYLTPDSKTYSTLGFYKNAALTFSKPLGSFTLYYYDWHIGPEEYIMTEVGESWLDLFKPFSLDDCFMLIARKDSPFSSHLEAAQKAFMKKACVLEDDPDRDNRLAARQREKAEAAAAAKKAAQIATEAAAAAAEKARRREVAEQQRSTNPWKMEEFLKHDIRKLLETKSAELRAYVTANVSVLTSNKEVIRNIFLEIISGNANFVRENCQTFYNELASVLNTFNEFVLFAFEVNHVIQENFRADNETYGTTLSMIREVNGDRAYIGRDGSIYFRKNKPRPPQYARAKILPSPQKRSGFEKIKTGD